jgi:STE24 endopeptidase
MKYMLNAFSLIIVIAMAVDYLLDVAANLLNLRALALDVPPALDGIYKREDYRRSQEYTRAATRFGFVSGTFSLVVMLAFWFSGGFRFLDGVVRSWSLPLIPSGLIFVAILVGAYGLLSLPLGVYHTFVIEQRFGFNRTTPRLFVIDRLKGLGLALILGAPLLAGVLFLFEYGGPFAWLYAWAAVTAFLLIVQYVAPTWILPLFNKFTPMPDGELKSAILEYARANDFPVSKLFIVDSSRRSTRANAYFTGIGRNKRIALFDTLVQQHTTRELVGVLAHEIGHYKKKHVIQGALISIVHTWVIFFLLSVFLKSPGLYTAFGVQASVYAGLIFFSLLYTPVEMLLSIVMNMVSRRNEKQADRFAVLTTSDPSSLADALKRLSANNLTNLTPHPLYVFLNYSHPPLLERIEAILASPAKTGAPSAQ